MFSGFVSLWMIYIYIYVYFFLNISHICTWCIRVSGSVLIMILSSAPRHQSSGDARIAIDGVKHQRPWCYPEPSKAVVILPGERAPQGSTNGANAMVISPRILWKTIGNHRKSLEIIENHWTIRLPMIVIPPIPLLDFSCPTKHVFVGRSANWADMKNQLDRDELAHPAGHPLSTRGWEGSLWALGASSSHKSHVFWQRHASSFGGGATVQMTG